MDWVSEWHTVLHSRTTYLNANMRLIKIYAPLSNLDIKVKIMISKIKAKVTSLK